jgi:hypothetical protein
MDVASHRAAASRSFFVSISSHAGGFVSSFIGLAARAALIWIFGTAVVSKVSSRVRWAAFVDALPALGLPTSVPPRLAAAVVVAGEVETVAALVVAPQLGAALAAGLLVLFSLALVAAVGANRRASCHCFGAGDAPVGRIHIVRNVILLVVSGIGFWIAPSGRVELSSASAAAVIYGAWIGFVVTHWDDLVFLLGVRMELPEPAEPPR